MPTVRTERRALTSAVCLWDAGEPPWGWLGPSGRQRGRPSVSWGSASQEPSSCSRDPKSCRDTGKGHTDGPLPVAKQSEWGARGTLRQSSPEALVREVTLTDIQPSAVFKPHPCLPSTECLPSACSVPGRGLWAGAMEGEGPHHPAQDGSHSPMRQVPRCPFCR